MTTLSDRNTPFPDFKVGLPTIQDYLDKPTPASNISIGPLIPGYHKVPEKPSITGKALDELMKQEAVKKDDGKPDWSLVPFEALEGMVRVLEFGAKKYSRNNWQTNGGFSYRRVLTACIRHLFAYMRGENNDPESGLSHISHAQCNLLFIGYYLTNRAVFNKDDRGT